MRRHAKASSAGPTLGKGRRFALLAVVVGAFLAVPAHAAADLLTVTLSGTGTGTVTSSPAGIECSNTPGNEKLSSDDCTQEFGILETVTLTAVPDDPAILNQWTGDTTDFPPEFPSTCNSGSTNPCSFLSLFGTPTVDANFGPPPPPPLATTGGTGEVNSFFATLEGAVNPGGNQVGSCRFEYGPTVAYGKSVPCSPKALGAGNTDVSVSARTAAIEPSTTYHYRVVATNAGGSSAGDDRTFITPAAPPDDCPNALRRAEQGSRALRLPACMALEMVSPPKKFNQPARDGMPSLDGNRVMFRSIAALAETPKEGNIFDSYVATRTPSGWVTSPTSLPAIYTRGSEGVGAACTYSEDFSRWSMYASTAGQAKISVTSAFQGRLDGGFSPLSPTMVPNSSTLKLEINYVQEGICQGASADSSHLFFSMGSSRIGFLPGDPVSGNDGLASQSNVYEAYRDESGNPTVELLQRDKDGDIVGNLCGASIGGINSNPGARRGSVSPDASRVYFSTSPAQPAGEPCNPINRRIMKRVQTPDGPEISELVTSECNRVAPECKTLQGDDSYMGASQEGSKVFFITNRQLANSDLDSGSQCTSSETEGCDLYLYDESHPVGSRLTQVSAGEPDAPTPGEGGEVMGLGDFAGNGSRAYFVAKGVLTSAPNQAGDTALAGERNLYMYERDEAHPGGQILFIATLSSEDFEVYFNSPGVNLASAAPLLGSDRSNQAIGGDGHILAFISSASLTPEDTDGGARDIYRFDSTTQNLELVSKAAPGGEDGGPSGVTLPSNFANNTVPRILFRRWMSEDGGSIVFMTTEGLDPTDVDGGESAYLWRDGTVTAVGQSRNLAPTVSFDGTEVVFNSDDQLLPEDRDAATDIYVARADGGYPFPVPSVPCTGEACQTQSSRPAGQGAASDSFVGAGNLTTQSGNRHKKRRHKKKQHKRRHAHAKQAANKQGGNK